MIAVSKQSGRSLPRTSSLCSKTAGRSAPSGWPPQSILRIIRSRFCDRVVPSGFSVSPDLHAPCSKSKFGGAVGSHTSHYFAVLKGGFALEGKRRATVPILQTREHHGRRIQRRSHAYDRRRIAEIRHSCSTIDNLGRS